MGDPAAGSMLHGAAAGTAALVATPPRLRCQPFRRSTQQHRVMTHATESGVEGAHSLSSLSAKESLHAACMMMSIGQRRWNPVPAPQHRQPSSNGEAGRQRLGGVTPRDWHHPVGRHIQGLRPISQSGAQSAVLGAENACIACYSKVDNYMFA